MDSYEFTAGTALAFRRLLASVLLFLCLAASAPRAKPIDEETLDFYLMDVVAGGYVLAESISAYRHDRAWYVHFVSFLEAVEFPIRRKNSLWSGWFLNEQNEFTWSMDDSEAESFIETGEGVFVALEALDAWFGLQITPNVRVQTLSVRSGEPLPFQQRKSRKSARNRHHPQVDRDVDVRIPDQYRWATLPLLDLSSRYRIQGGGGETQSTSQTSLTLGMDLLKHSVLYAGSTGSDSLSRLTIERGAAVAGGEIGFGIDRYAVGDIFEQGSTLVNGGGAGTGFVIERGSSTSGGSQGRVTITGDGTPGWDAELYRNGSLITFGRVGEDGSFVFPDQETVYGENIFVVKLFGPRGQVREERQTVWGGGIDLERGEYNFSISHIDFTRGFIGGDRPAAGLPSEKTTSVRYARAVTDYAQVGAGYTQAWLAAPDMAKGFSDSHYAVLDGRMNLSTGLLLGEWARQRGQGDAWSLTYLSGLNGHNVALSRREFHNFASPYTVGRNVAEAENQLMLAGPLDVAGFHDYTLRLTQRERSGGVSDIRLFNRLGAHWGPVSMSNDLDYLHVGTGEEFLHGKLRLTGRWNLLSLRGQLDYDPADSDPFNQISAMLQWHATDRLYCALSAYQDLKDDRILHIESSLNARIGKLDLSFTLQTSSADFWAVGIGVARSFGWNGANGDLAGQQARLAQTGRATLNFFVDLNDNGIQEAGEPPVDWAAYKEYHSSASDPATVQLDAVPPHLPLRIESSDFRFKDPFLVAREEVYQLYTHSGSEVNVDIPVVTTGDVEGHLLPVPGREATVSGLRVVLYDSEGQQVAGTRSEFDGYYSFQGLPAGDYEVVVHGSARKAEVHRQWFSLDTTDSFVPLPAMFIYWN